MNQTLPLRDQIKALEQLQEIDLKIDHLQRTKSALPASLKTLDDSLLKLKTSGDTKRKALEELEKVQRQTTAALDLNRDRQTRSSTRLESVQNSHEFQAANKEIDQLNKMNLGLEEQSKKSTVDSEAVKKDLSDVTTQIEKLQQDRDAQASAISGQSGELDQQIGMLSVERSGFAKKVEPRLLSQYDRVRGARAGLGIVPAVAGRCKGCNMMVPPQLYNMIHKAIEVHACPSCHRILYVPQSSAPEAPKPDDKS